MKYALIHNNSTVEFATLFDAEFYKLSNLIDSEIQEVQDAVASVDQKQLDYERYLKRAKVKDQIIAEMASENMERVRNGLWTVNDLISLTQDPELKLVLDDVSTLSYELAVSKVMAISNPLITSQIKTDWSFKLQSHFYL